MLEVVGPPLSWGPVMLRQLLSPRITKKSLAALCRRLSLTLEAGIDLRKVLSREQERVTSFFLRRRMARIAEAINDGASLAEAIEATGDYFPVLFVRMVEMGEKTGHLGEALRHLADHYDQELTMRRNFLASIAWPMIELFLALSVIGLVIWISGFIQESTHSDVDIFGLGLVGTSGLIKYVTVLGLIFAGAAVFYHSINRGLVWIRPVQRLLLRLPVLGPPLQTLALARVAWSLNLAADSGMDMRKAVRLALETGNNARYLDVIPAIEASIAAGNPLVEAFEETGVFPFEFVETIRVGEESGQVVECMARLARQYNDRGAAAMKVLGTVAGVIVYAAVASVIIMFIFRAFASYMGQYNNALNMK
jgi:type IV pilus assembly protein PilC